MDQIDNIDKIYLINWNTFMDFENIKIKNFILKIQQDDNFKFITDTKENIVKFIIKNKDIKYLLVYPIYCAELKANNNETGFFNSIITYLREQRFIISKILPLQDLKIKIIFSTMDYFNGFNERTITNKFIYQPKNHYIFVPMLDLDDFKDYIFKNKETTWIKNKELVIKKTFPLCTFYAYHFNYNKEPEHNYIAVTGKLKSYPEREILDKFSRDILKNKVVTIPYNWNYRYSHNFKDYIETLSNYICCFISGAGKINRKKSMILHKFFEVLGSGSLLLCSSKDTQMINKIGLKDNVNCMIVNVYDDKELIEKVNFILNLDNRDLINNIRMNGYFHAMQNLSHENKFAEFKNLIKEIKDT